VRSTSAASAVASSGLLLRSAPATRPAWCSCIHVGTAGFTTTERLHAPTPAPMLSWCAQGPVFMVRFYEGEVAQDNKAAG